MQRHDVEITVQSLGLLIDTFIDNREAVDIAEQVFQQSVPDGFRELYPDPLYIWLELC